MIIIQRQLKGTRFAVTIELDEAQYAHLLFVQGQRSKSQARMPLDLNMAQEMRDLADHFEHDGR